MRKANNSIVVVVTCGTLLAGALACGTGGQSAPSGSAATAAPATEASNSQASGSSSMPTIDPCTIVTQDEASAFFGVPSGPGDSSTGSITATCNYRSTDNADGLAIILAYVPGGAANSAQFSNMKQGNQDVPGLGDGATWLADVSQLDVAKGNWILTLNGSIKGKHTSLDTLKSMAQTALGRLP